MKKNSVQKIASILVPTALFLGLVAPALAENLTGSASVGIDASGAGTSLRLKGDAKGEASMSTAVAHATEAITARIKDLTALAARVNAMVRVNSATKASISASIQTTISQLTALQAKISADTDMAVLRTDIAQITGGTRVYMLVAPQARILAASDRVGVIGNMITAVNAKLGARISAAVAAGKDVTAITTAQADMTAKIADANVQAQAAITAVANLTPDNGDKTKMQANDAALKQARADLSLAEKDLRAAQKDIKAVIMTLRGFKLEAGANTKTSVTQ